MDKIATELICKFEEEVDKILAEHFDLTVYPYDSYTAVHEESKYAVYWLDLNNFNKVDFFIIDSETNSSFRWRIQEAWNRIVLNKPTRGGRRWSGIIDD